jgi:small-conductance mechanosensitive channel
MHEALTHPLVAPILATLLLLGGAVGFYVYFRRHMLTGAETRKARSMRLRIVHGGLTLLVLVGLMQIWHAQVPWLEEIHQWLSGNRIYANLLWTLVAGVAAYLLARGAQHVLTRNITELAGRHKVRRAVSRSAFALFVVAGVLIWTKGEENIGVPLGIAGAGLALALQETILCVAGWGLIMTQKPFDIGDRIEIDNDIGDVIDIRVFQTTLLEVGNWVQADQSTGRLVHFPNSRVFRKALCNYTKGFPFIWNELATIVTFESDWRRAKEIILRQAQEEADKLENQVRRQITLMQGQYAIQYEHLRPIVYTDIADVGVSLTLRYLSPVRERRATSHRIWEGVLDAFIKHPNIDFAYPTTRIYRNNEEGKPGTGGPAHPVPPQSRYYSTTESNELGDESR